MNLRILFSALIVLLCSLCFGQKAKVKDQKVKANFLSLPETGFSKATTVYSVDLTTDLNALQHLGSTESGIKKSMDIKGYSQVQEKLGPTIYLNLDGPGGSPLDLQTDSKKNKEGKTWKEYSYKVKVYGTCNVKVADETGSTIFEEVIDESKTVQSKKYRSIKELKKNFDTDNFYKKNRTDLLKTIIKKSSVRLNRHFGYVPNTAKVDFRKLTSKKHPEYNEWQANESVVEDAFAKLTPYDNFEYRKAILPAIEFWKSKESTYSYKDKNQKKLKSACLQNLVMANLYAEEYKTASDYCQQIIDSGENDKWGKKQLEKIGKIEANLKRLDRRSRFFKIEMSKKIEDEIHVKELERTKAIEEGDITAFPDFKNKMKIDINTHVVAGVYYAKSGVNTEGYWAFDDELKSGLPDFRKAKRIRFGYDNDGALEVGSPNFSKLDSIRIGEIVYEVKDVTIGAGLKKVKLKNGIVEIVNSYRKTDLVYVHPSFTRGSIMGKTSDMESQLVVYDKKDKKYKSTVDMLGSFHKGMKKIVDGCEVAEEYLEEVKKEKKKGGLLNRAMGHDNSNAIIKTLELYDQCEN